MRQTILSLCTISLLLGGGAALAQAPAAPATQTPAATTAPRILGDVTSFNPLKRQLVIKMATGDVTVQVDEAVVCKRVAPDAKNLDGAEVIKLGDIRPGDRVWARTTTPVADAPNTFQAKQLVLMSATSIAERNQREREAWQRRGLQGEVTAVAADKYTVKLRDNSTVTLQMAPKAEIRRYPPGSVDFNSAKTVAANDIKVGDTIFGRGERSADGQAFTAEMLVLGEIPRPTFGVVASVNAEKKEITIKQRDREVVIHLTPETMLRVLPEDAFTQTAQAGGPGGQGGEARAARPDGPAGEGRQRRGEGPDGPGGPGRGMGGARGMFNNAEAWMERIKSAPELKLADLKAGEFVVANGPKSEDGKSVKALFVMRVPIPNIGGGNGLSIGGGGFGDGQQQ